jgi:hypothetical protein
MLREIELGPRRCYRLLVENNSLITRIDRHVVETHPRRAVTVYWKPVWGVEARGHRQGIGQALRPVVTAAIEQEAAPGWSLRLATTADLSLLAWVRERERMWQPPPPPKRPRGRPPRRRQDAD